LNKTKNKINLTNEIKLILPLIIIALVSLSLDQITKTIVRNEIAIRGTVEVIRGFFEISYSENTGAVFGSFQGRNRIFIIVSFLAIIFIFFYYSKFKENLWMKLALGFILGGALGNLTDRIFFGFVTDFLRFKIWFLRPFWWPNFNIADASVTIGALMLFIGMFRINWKFVDE
jgi:signal peptidase II